MKPHFASLRQATHRLKQGCRLAATLIGIEVLAVTCTVSVVSPLHAADWIQSGLSTNVPMWGIRDGLLWAVPPGGFRKGEPRGLIRLGYPVLDGGGYDLINFIAIEPIVRGRRGFSELEKSRVDGAAGLSIKVEAPGQSATNNVWPGNLKHKPDGTEQLEVTLLVEPFENGAHVRLLAHQRSDKPDELELTVFKEADSEPLDCCILTATMGNMARTRQLWLKDRVVNSLELYKGYQADAFAPHREFPLSQLYRTEAGDALVAVSNNEQSPGDVFPFPGSETWHYAGIKVTQFWRLPSGDVRDDLQVVVNGRYVYWGSHQPIPGGVAFENFELRQNFRQGQSFVFGITRATPKELGL